jgi:hypothetical protein
MVHLLEARGVRVFSLAEDAADVDAFCFWHKRAKDDPPAAFVFLNLQESGERGGFDAAHELGHLATHRAIDFRGKDVEREADGFARRMHGHPDRASYGILSREGMRASELAALRWRDLDLEHVLVRLDENKTDDPRAWAPRRQRDPNPRVVEEEDEG